MSSLNRGSKQEDHIQITPFQSSRKKTFWYLGKKNDHLGLF